MPAITHSYQPGDTHDLLFICCQSRSSISTSSSLRISLTIHSFRCVSPCLWNRLSLRQPTAGACIEQCCEPSVRPFVRLSVCPAGWRYARLAVSNAFDRGQHVRLCPLVQMLSAGAYRFAARYFVQWLLSSNIRHSVKSDL